MKDSPGFPPGQPPERGLLYNLTEESFPELIQSAVRPMIEKLAPKTEEIKYLSREEVCELLHISKPTLGSYINKGMLKGKKIGRRVLFDESDVKQALQEMPSRISKKWKSKHLMETAIFPTQPGPVFITREDCVTVIQSAEIAMWPNWNDWPH